MASHYMGATREYSAWQRMKRSVANPKYHLYKKYGALGVTMCPEWEKFGRFYQDMGPMPENCNGLVLNDGNKLFSKENCQWKVMKNSLRNVKKKSISLVLDIYLYESIKKSCSESCRKGKGPKAISSYIQDILLEVFPCHKQQDMFEETK